MRSYIPTTPRERAALLAEAEATRRVCIRCGKEKRLEAFSVQRRAGRPDRYHSWCRVCVSRYQAERTRTEAHRAWLAGYLARPEVRRMRSEYERKRREEPGYNEHRREKRREYDRTPRAKILRCRASARHRLRGARTDARRAALTALIAQYDRELERLASL